MSFSALLFDLDGTLVDTITLYEKAVLQSLREIGIKATHAEFQDWYVRPLHLGQILELYGESEEHIPALRAHRDELYIELLRTESEWLPGARELLQEVTEGTGGTKDAQRKITSAPSVSSVPSPRLSPHPPLALITGSWMSYVDAIDSHLGVKQYFQTIITADDIHKFMKPHPHGLFLAADRLGVDPKDCVYLGDQQFDIDAAKAAGMEGWLLRSEWTPKNVKGATRVFGSVGEAQRAIAHYTADAQR